MNKKLVVKWSQNNYFFSWGLTGLFKWRFIHTDPPKNVDNVLISVDYNLDTIIPLPKELKVPVEASKDSFSQYIFDFFLANFPNISHILPTFRYYFPISCLYFTYILPIFHKCYTYHMHISPMLYPTHTLPLFYPYLTHILPVSYLYSTSTHTWSISCQILINILAISMEASEIKHSIFGHCPKKGGQSHVSICRHIFGENFQIFL